MFNQIHVCKYEHCLSYKVYLSIFYLGGEKRKGTVSFVAFIIIIIVQGHFSPEEEDHPYHLTLTEEKSPFQGVYFISYLRGHRLSTPRTSFSYSKDIPLLYDYTSNMGHIWHIPA